MLDREREKLTIDWPRTEVRATGGEILLIEGVGMFSFAFDLTQKRSVSSC